MREQINAWFSERLKLDILLDFLHKKLVPEHKHSFWYFFGGLSIFFFVIQIITGVLLLVYYSPTPATAYESVSYIMTQAPFGWLIRSLHSWSAHLMVACVFIHLFSTYFMRAYRKPRELMWITGVLQFFLVLGFAFTGSLLPWNMLGYFATQIGTEIPRSIPLLGDFMVKILRGGEFVDEESLKRLFSLHVVILPLATLSLVAIHIILNQIQGTSTPIGTKLKGPGIPFYPNYIYRDLLMWIGGFCLLFGLAIFFPVELGLKANPFASAPLGIKPEWYFLPLFQTLKMFPATVFGLNSEMVVNSLVGVLATVLLLVPFIDRKAAMGERNKIFTFCGAVAAVYMLVMIVMAYLS